MNTVLKILAWLFKYKPITRTIKIIHRESQRLGLKEWQSQPHLTRQAMEAMNNGDMKAMMDVLENENPAHWHLPDDSTIEQRALHQRFIEGYCLCMNNFQALTQFTPPKGEMPEADFGTQDTSETT